MQEELKIPGSTSTASRVVADRSHSRGIVKLPWDVNLTELIVK